MERVKLKPKPVGGRREGSGRKPGYLVGTKRYEIMKAALKGLLPHALLLEWARTGVMGSKTLKVEQRIECARLAAPYYAPRLSATIVVDHAKAEAEGRDYSAFAREFDRRMSHIDDEGGAPKDPKQLN